MKHWLNILKVTFINTSVSHNIVHFVFCHSVKLQYIIDIVLVSVVSLTPEVTGTGVY